MLGDEGVPAVLDRQAIAEFYGIRATRAQHVDELSPREIKEARIILSLRATINSEMNRPVAQRTEEED